MKKIASLSSIRLEGNDLKNLTKDFNQILEFVQKINEVDTEGVEPMKHIARHISSHRPSSQEGQEPENVTLEDIQKIAPDLEGRYFVVPQVIENA